MFGTIHSSLSIPEILRLVVAKCVMGAAVVEICEMGDKLILEETGKVYKKEKEMKKGMQWRNIQQRRRTKEYCGQCENCG